MAADRSPAPIAASVLTQAAALPSVAVRRPSRLRALHPLGSVVMVGGMCAGKSTLGRAAVASLPDTFFIAPRYSTREQRRGDANEGLVTVSREEFQNLVNGGQFALAWERPVADGTVIGYGCVSDAVGKVPIFMAGHGIYTNPTSVRPRHALDHALVVGVSAPIDVRLARLAVRSPDVIERNPTRVAALLEHDDELMADYVDVIVRNHAPHETNAPREFVALLRAVLGVAR